MEFQLDWEKGTRPARPGLLSARPRATQPARRPRRRRPAANTPIDYDVRGRPRISPTATTAIRPTGRIAMLWIDRDGLAVPVAAMGRANDWDNAEVGDVQAAVARRRRSRRRDPGKESGSFRLVRSQRRRIGAAGRSAVHKIPGRRHARS